MPVIIITSIGIISLVFNSKAYFFSQGIKVVIMLIKMVFGQSEATTSINKTKQQR